MNRQRLDDRLAGRSVMSAIVSPKLRYLVELRARELDIALSTFIAASIDSTMKDATCDNYFNDSLWHNDPGIRLYRLATSRADLLTDSERLLWRSVIKDKHAYAEDGTLCPDKISHQWQRLIVGF